MFSCNDCGHVFRDTAESWNEVDDRDELIEETILKCPICHSADVGVADEIEENDFENMDDPEYARLRELFPNTLLDY